MLKVIGHRGASSLAPENTIAAIKAGIAAGVDAVELDVRVTADQYLVLCHDATLERLWNIDKKVSAITLARIQRLTAENGLPITTLEEALNAVGSTPIVIEGKDSDWAKPLANILRNHPKKPQTTVISFNHRELFVFGTYCTDITLYCLEHHNSFDAINNARVFDFDGINLNYWLLNPLTFWLAKRHKLGIMVYTINKPWIAEFIRFLYPGISITTDVPQKMQFVRPRHLRVRIKRSKTQT